MTARTTLTAIALAATLDAAANYLAARYLVPIGPWFVPGGTFLFALGFTVYDYLRRFCGFWPTITAILLGLLISLGYNAVFGGGVGRIALAGVFGLVTSSSTDLLMQSVTLRWPIWRYVVASNTLSLAVDTVVFTLVAFAALPSSVQINIMEGQYLVKVLMMVVSIPLVYSARRLGAKAVVA